jgi:type VI secretion system protein ImpL
METLSQLARHLPIVLIVVGLLLVLIVLYVIFLVVRSSPQLRQAEAAPPPSGDPPPADPLLETGGSPLRPLGRAVDLRLNFRRTVRALKRKLGSRDAVYRLPFYLVIGTAGAESPDFWQSADLGLPFGPPRDDSHRSDRCNFWIYDRGVVADLGGDYVLRQDGTSDQAGLRAVLGLFQKYRPARPLDGVVVPIALEALRSTHDLEDFSALEQRADAVYRALWQIQKQVGMLFPVYVVITGGERLPGLAALASSLPEAQRGEMLGWSNPYQLSQAYRSEWVEEGVQALARDLRAVQKEAFAQGVPPPVAESLLLLPSEAAELEQPLRRYLDRLFKATAYHEPLQLRGIYLCGRDEARNRSLFLRDLLERKVFAEFAVARPAPRALLARQRLLTTLQWTALVFFTILALGTTRAYLSLAGDRLALERFFGDAKRNLTDARRLRAEIPPQEPELSVAQRWARSTLQSAQPLRNHHFGSLFIPHSWGGQLQRDVDASLEVIFQQLVFDAMKRSFESRVHNLALDTEAAARPARLADPRFFEWSGRDPVPIEASRELQDLRFFLGELAQVERHAELFNSLRVQGKAGDLAKLVKDPDDSLGLDLGEVAFSDPLLIQRALRSQNREADLPAAGAGVPLKTRELTDALVDFADANPLAAGLENLAYEIDHLGEADFGPSRIASYRRLLEKVRAVRSELTKPGHEWVFRDTFHLGQTFDDALAAARTSSLVGSAGADGIAKTIEAAWIALRRRLAGIHSPYTGPLLQIENGVPRMALSGDLQLLELALEGFLGEEFMGEAGNLEPRPFLPGHRILWDSAVLAGAVDLYQPYQSFRERGLAAFPGEMHDTLDHLARETLADRLAAKVAQAQSFQPEVSPSHATLFEQELRAATLNLTTAAPLLEKLQSIFGDLDQWNRQQALQLLVGSQSGALLRQLDEMVERERPYHLRDSDFSWWQGDQPVGYAAFEKTDLAEMTFFLDGQRRRLEQLATELGQPLASLLSRTGFHQQPQYRALFDRWQGLAAALQDYEAKRPGGSLEMLEKFLLVELPQTSAQSCAKAPPPPLRSGDFFATRLAAIQRALLLRCADLRGHLAAREWRRLESFFNRRLAGRYPFAPPAAAMTSAALSDDLRAFFAIFDQALPILRATRDDHGPLQPIAADVARFLDEMERVRAFFAPFLDAKVRSAEPFFDLDLEMRVNRGHELCADRIIEWVFDPGGSPAGPVDQRTTGRTVRWQPGQPLELRLRWARDALALPVAGDGAQAGFYVDGPWAVWSFESRWALLQLLEALQAGPADFDSFEDPSPHTLKLATPMRRVPAPAGDGLPPAAAGVADPEGCPPDAGETRVFVRLRVLAPEDKALLVRSHFPTAAPRLEDPTSPQSEISTR